MKRYLVKIGYLTLVLSGLFLAYSHGEEEIKGNHLRLTVSPRIGIAPIMVRARAEIVGPETEEWYCPEVQWQYGNSSAGIMSDCPPFENREYYERRYSRVIPFRHSGRYTIVVTLLKWGRPIAEEKVEVKILCGVSEACEEEVPDMGGGVR
jgi:hypothetical protein